MIELYGAWTDSAPYNVSSSFSAALSLMFFGDTATLTVGTGPDHGLFDVYVNHSFWQSFDGYASATGERAIDIPLASMGPHLLEIRHRHEKNLASTDYTLRFRQLVTPNTAFIRYTYDALSRLQEARYNPASDLDAPDADLLRRYQYTYDLAGNRLSEAVALDGGTPTVTSHTYNAANQISNQGFTYDNNGNLTSDGVNTYAWDRADRLLSVNNTAYQYAYDGMGSRVSQTVSSIVTQYLLDVQPGLVNVLAQTTGGNTSRFVYGPRGILAYQNGLGNWSGIVQDGLNSVRMEVDDNLAVQAAQNYGPYGVPFGGQGTFGLPFAFTGEPTDANGLVYLRARYYSPALGVFPNLDPVEGVMQQAMSLNRYGYTQWNPTNRVDPSGMLMEKPGQWDSCTRQEEESCKDCCLPLLGFPFVQYWACVAACELGERSMCISDCMTDQSIDRRILNSVVRIYLFEGTREQILNGETYSEASVGTYVGNFTGIGSNCFLTHNHWALRPSATFMAIGQTADAWAATETGDRFIPWDVVVKDYSYGGQSLFCIGNQMGNLALQEAPLRRNPQEIMTECDSYSASLVRHDVNSPTPQFDLGTITIEEDSHIFGFIVFESEDSVRPGESGSPIVVNGTIVGIIEREGSGPWVEYSK